MMVKVNGTQLEELGAELFGLRLGVAGGHAAEDQQARPLEGGNRLSINGDGGLGDTLDEQSHNFSWRLWRAWRKFIGATRRLL